MSDLDDIIANAIKYMALVESEAAKVKLERSSKSYSSVGMWKAVRLSKISSIGFATGVSGGPAAFFLESLDIAYLLSMTGQGCYGVGHIRNRPIDYEHDIPLILAIWSGVGEATNEMDFGKLAYGKVVIHIGGQAGLTLMGQVTGGMSTKIITKAMIGVSNLVFPKIVAKAGGKITAKITSKLSAKWIPVIGGVVSAGINYWVMNGLINAANTFYTHEYLTLDDNIAVGLPGC